MEFWQNMTARERGLISLAAALTVIIAIYFAVVRPLENYLTESERVFARAQATHATVLKGAAEMKALAAENSEQVREQETLRVAVAKAARENGVSISRLQPGTDGSLSVWVESVPSANMFHWIEAMGSRYGIAPEKVVAQKTMSAGRLRVQLQFAAQP